MAASSLCVDDEDAGSCLFLALVPDFGNFFGAASAGVCSSRLFLGPGGGVGGALVSTSISTSTISSWEVSAC